MYDNKINYARVNAMLTIIKGSKLPRDRWGQILSYQDLIAWYGLDEKLTPAELDVIKPKLADLVEIQNAIEMMDMPQF